MALKRGSGDTFVKDVNIKLQDGVAGTIKVTYRKVPQDKIDDWHEDNTPNSEVFDEIVADIREIQHEVPKDGGGTRWENVPDDQQLAVARQDPAIVTQVVQFFFSITRQDKPGGRISKRRH